MQTTTCSRTTHQQCQCSLTDQLQELVTRSQAAGHGTLTQSTLLSTTPVAQDSLVIEELRQCMNLANQAGLYDAADFIRYSLLKLS